MPATVVEYEGTVCMVHCPGIPMLPLEQERTTESTIGEQLFESGVSVVESSIEPDAYQLDSKALFHLENTHSILNSRGKWLFTENWFLLFKGC